MRVFVTGANRGIGLEFVRQCLARGDTVEALCRCPEGAHELQALAASARGALRVLGGDVGSDASVAAARCAGGDEPLDLVINNAGVRGAWTSLADLPFDSALETLSVNALGPLRIARAYIDRLRLGSPRVMVAISSGLGSIADNTTGGVYDYRMSKAALNMAVRNLAHEFGGEGVISVSFNPGWVQTDMGGPGAPLRVEESVSAMLARIATLTQDDNGAFLDYRGGRFAW